MSKKKFINRNVYWLSTPLKGFYRCGDYFQILPLNSPDIPTHQNQKEYPVLLEYSSAFEFDQFMSAKGVDELLINGEKWRSEKNEIIFFLNVISNNQFVEHDIEYQWGIPIPKENQSEMNSMTSHLYMRLFQWDGKYKLMNAPDQFTEPTGDALKLSEFIKYYFNFPNQDRTNDLDFSLPQNTEQIFEAYSTFSGKTKLALDYSMRHANLALKYRNKDLTYSLISCFTALETLVDLEYKGVKNEHCKSCGQPQYKVRKKFTEFLSKYIGGSVENVRKYKKYYELRSTILHTGEFLESEIKWAQMTEEKRARELQMRVEIIQITKVAIIQWIVKNNELNSR